MKHRSEGISSVWVTMFALLVLTAAVLMLTGCGGSAGTETSSTATGSASDGSAGGASAAEDKAVTLSMICFLDKTHEYSQTLFDWIDAVKTATNGTVTIDWKGGPEVIPALEQIEAVRTGVVDIGAEVSAYYSELNPAVKVMPMSPYTPAEERQNGVYEFLQREHRAIGVEYIGRWQSVSPFYIFLNKEISSPADLKGMSIRTRAAYDNFFKALGISGVSVDTGEVYTALERGIVQGFGWGLIGVTDMSWDTKAPFVIDHGFWGATNATLIFNPESWGKLSAKQQEAIKEATAQYEMDKMVPYFTKANEDDRAELEARGVKFVKFSEADGKSYLALADQVEWDALKAQLPDKFDEIQRLFGLAQ